MSVKELIPTMKMIREFSKLAGKIINTEETYKWQERLYALRERLGEALDKIEDLEDANRSLRQDNRALERKIEQMNKRNQSTPNEDPIVPVKRRF